MSPIYIQTLVDTLEKNNADISACKYIRRKETTKYHKWSKQASKKEEVYNKKESIEMLMSGRLFNVCVWNKLYKREVVNNIRFDENVYYAEDVQFNYFAVKNVERVALTNTTLYVYVQRKSYAVNSKFNEKRLSGVNAINVIVEDCLQYFPEIASVAKAWYYMVNLEMLYWIWKYKVQDFKTAKKLLIEIKDNFLAFKKNKLIQLYSRTLLPLGMKFLNSRIRARRIRFIKKTRKAY